MESAFDVWGNGDGKVKAAPVKKRFVDDNDAPYGFDRHLLRVSAVSARSAQAAYRAECREPMPMQRIAAARRR